MNDYLDEAKSERYSELCHKGSKNLTSGEYKELSTLIDEKLVNQEKAVGLTSRTLLAGICGRCGREFSNSVPEVTYPKGIHEIACVGWCAGCNAFAMSVIFRWSSAFVVDAKKLRDPARGGNSYAST